MPLNSKGCSAPFQELESSRAPRPADDAKTGLPPAHPRRSTNHANRPAPPAEGLNPPYASDHQAAQLGRAAPSSRGPGTTHLAMDGGAPVPAAQRRGRVPPFEWNDFYGLVWRKRDGGFVADPGWRPGIGAYADWRRARA